MGKVIMTVDDSASVRQLVRLTLSKGGDEVIEAVDGQDGLDKLAGKQVDLILTDLNMPRIDGIEFIKKVRENPLFKFLPIVMLTTEGQAGKKDAGKAAGATAWIVKPFKPEQILAVKKKILG